MQPLSLLPLRFPLRAWICLFLCWCSPLLVFAQVQTLQIGAAERYPLSTAFAYFEDASTQLGIDDMAKETMQARFKPLGQDGTSTNFGSTRSAIWLRVHLQVAPDAPRRWLLEVANPPLDRLDIYVSKTTGGFERRAGGDSLSFADRQVPHRNHVLVANLEPGREATIFLRVMSEGNVSVPAILWQPEALWRNDHLSYSVFSLYFGLLFGLVLYNLLLLFSVRDSAYLIYVLFATSVGMSQLANSGIAAEFWWPHSVWWNNISINIAYGTSGAYGTWFARSFLSSRANLPKLDRLLQALVFAWVASIFASLFLPRRVAFLIVTLLALIGVASIVAAGVKSIQRRHSGAIYFGYAWGALLSGIVVLSAHNHGYLPTNIFTANALLVGSALEMVLLSFALADRINTSRREKEQAQAQVATEHALVEALHQSQERHLAVIEHVAEGMVVMQEGRVVFVNTKAAEMLGADKPSLMESGIVSRFHADDQALLAKCARSPDGERANPQRFEVRLALPNQLVKWLEFGVDTVPWDGTTGQLLYFLDITDRHHAEMETRAAISRQQELNQLRSRFVAMTSHEFRTPLAAILSAQDLLKSYDQRLPAAERTELLDIIESGVNRMTGMLERVLLLGQVDAHMLEFKPQTLDVKALCRQLLEEAQTQWPDRQTNLRLEFSEKLQEGQYDGNLLRHIFGNLLSNAIKYSPNGGDVCLKVYRQGGQTLFEVSDSGIGVPQGEVDHLFDAFHRASNVGAIQGTGLGLAIVKQAVDLHGGTISVTSVIGRGTCFTVALPTVS